MNGLIAAIILGGVVALIVKLLTKRITVFEYERGLKYKKGKFQSVLNPGRYWHLPSKTSIHKVDIRPSYASISGQEVLSSDGVTIKVSLAVNYEVTDPNVAINKVQNYHDALYLELQLALRQIIASMDIDAVLNSRSEIQTKLTDMTTAKIAELGLKLHSASVKDIMFPGKLKELFAQVVNAKKEGLAALERARGETAALRNLANAAKMVESNPSLLQLRLLQALGQSSGSTLVLGVTGNGQMVPVRTQKITEGASDVEPTQEP